MSYKPMQRYSRKLRGNRFLRMDDSLIVEVVLLFGAPSGSFGAGKDLVDPSSELVDRDLMGESREGLDLTFEVTPGR
jgi:hypothetical protein